MMKTILLSFALAISTLSFSQENKKGAKLVLGSEFIEYGTIKRGADGKRELIIKNEGDAPLIISGVGSSCGCTVPTWPRKPIMPNEEDKIIIKYATYRVGKINKSITIRSNSVDRSIRVVRLKGEIKRN